MLKPILTFGVPAFILGGIFGFMLGALADLFDASKPLQGPKKPFSTDPRDW